MFICDFAACAREIFRATALVRRVSVEKAVGGKVREKVTLLPQGRGGLRTQVDAVSP